MAFQPGQSGNPGGRPKENAEIKALARAHGKKAIEKLAAMLDSDDERIVTGAAQALLDRGFGKPSQAIVGGDEDDNPVALVHKVVREIVRADSQPKDG
jgi:hypothetical protein